ncbi:hypothetical protein ACFL2H_05335, partial [Planctomycetota bacterium]
RQKGEVDAYEFSVKPESNIRCRVWSHRLGTPFDSRLRILDKDGNQLGEGDDHDQTLDSMVDVKIPSGVKKVVAEISSQSGTYGDDSVYRMEVTPVPPHRVSVECDTNQITIPAGGQVVVPFRINRSGSKAPVTVSAEGASMLHFSDCFVAGTETRCLLEVSAPSNTQAITPLRFVASTGTESSYVTFQSVNPNVTFPPNVDLVAAVESSSSIAVEWKSEPFETSYPGGRFSGKVTVRRPAGHDVSLALITSQTEPPKNERDAKQIRLENVKAEGDTYTFEIVAPDGFPVNSSRVNDARAWTYAIRADLKSKDGKTLVGSAFTRLRRSTAKKALQLAIQSPTEKVFTIESGQTLNITGTISRLPEIEHPVIVRLLGIPDDSGVKADPVQADVMSGRYTLTVDASAATKAVVVDSLNLQAAFDSDDSSVRDVRSNNVGVKIGVRVAPPKKKADGNGEANSEQG